MTSETTSRLGWLRWAIPLSGLVLWLAGQPAPHADDLFFGGAAINLAEGRGLGNPWVGNWLQDQFQTDRFYVQFPYHTWLQGTWLRLTGISSGALRAFALLGAISGAYALADALRRGGATRCWTAIGCGLWATFILYYGLRADAAGLGLVGAGHLLLVRRRPAAQVAGLWLAGLGAATHPFALAVALPTLAAHFGVALSETPSPQRWRFTGLALIASVAGAAIVTGLGLLMIDGEEREFLRVFNAHRVLALPGPIQRWGFFYGQFLGGYEHLRRLPFAVAAIAILAVAAWRSPNTPRLRWLVLALTVLGVVGYFLYAQYVARYLVFALFISLILVRTSLRPLGGRTWAVAIGGFLILATWSDVLLHYARSLPPPPPAIAQLRSAIATSSQSHVVLDEFSIRYLYDFRPPVKTRDWQVGRPAGGRSLGFPIADKPADELWVVSAYKLAHAVSGSRVQPPYLGIAGRPFRSIELGVDLRLVP